MPLDHAAGLLVSVGGALVGGARLALAGQFTPATFWTDARRYGATVVYYAGEMCRALADAPSTPAEGNNPIRLFAGSGMRVDIWKRLLERFNTGVLEFYATTEGNAVLANVAGTPVGSLGKPLPGTAEVQVVGYDFENGRFEKNADGWLRRCFADQPGMLVARIDPSHSLASYEGAGEEGARRVLRDAFEYDDAWFVTGDVLRFDSHGRYFFVDRASDLILTEQGPVSSVQVEDVLYELPEIRHAVVYAARPEGAVRDVGVATLVVRDGYALDAKLLAEHLERRLDVHARPSFVLLRDSVPMSVGYRPLKSVLRAQTDLSCPPPGALRYDAASKGYVPCGETGHARTPGDSSMQTAEESSSSPAEAP